MATVIVEVRMLAGPKHSGQFGGAAPDALHHAPARARRRCTTSTATWRSPGLRREEWAGASYGDEEFRELAEIEPGMPFIGTGGLGERLWSGPALTVTGIDVQPVDKALNAVVPYGEGQDEPAESTPSRTRGGAGDPRAPPGEHAPVRHPARGHGHRDGHGVRRDRPRARPTRRRAPPSRRPGAVPRSRSRRAARSRS